MNCRRYDSTLAHIKDELENQWLNKQYPDVKTGNSEQNINFIDTCRIFTKAIKIQFYMSIIHKICSLANMFLS